MVGLVGTGGAVTATAETDLPSAEEIKSKDKKYHDREPSLAQGLGLWDFVFVEMPLVAAFPPSLGNYCLHAAR